MEADDRSSASLNAAHIIAEGKRIRFRRAPPKPQRPFAEDYDTAPPIDEQGRLLSDIEGRPLGAKFVAGRRFSGEADEPLSPEDIKGAIAEAGVGLKHARDDDRYRATEIPKALRGYYKGIDYDRGPPDATIFLNTGRKPTVDFVIAHEFGHAIDHLAGMLSATLTPEEIGELRTVYATLRYRTSKDGPKLQPEHFGYRGDDVNPELVAEGLRAYMTNPNYFKTVAPTAAAKIRKAVNENPYLKDAIQFNSLGAIGLIGTGVRGQDRDDQ